MLPKGKSRVAAILLRMKEKRDDKKVDDESTAEDTGDATGRTASMEDFIEAVKRGDAEAADKALCEWCDQHDGSHDDKDDDEEAD